MADLAALRSRAQDIFGLDLEDDEATELYNEADTELCTQSGWTQESVTLDASTYDGQTLFPLPDEVFEVLRVTVNGYPYPSVGIEDGTELNLESGVFHLRARGAWYYLPGPNGNGDRSTGSAVVYPACSEGDLVIAAAVVYPDPMVDDTDTPACPPSFERGLHAYVQAISLGGSEDDIERADRHMAEFDRQVNRLRAHRIRRANGNRGARMRVEGLTA